MLLRLEGIACGRSRFSDEDQAHRLTGFLFPVDQIYRLIMYAGRRRNIAGLDRFRRGKLAGGVAENVGLLPDGNQA